MIWRHTLGLLYDIRLCNRFNRRSVADKYAPVAPKTTWPAAFDFLMAQEEGCASSTPSRSHIKLLGPFQMLPTKNRGECASKTISDIKSVVTSVNETALDYANKTLQAIIPSIPSSI